MILLQCKVFKQINYRDNTKELMGIFELTNMLLSRLILIGSSVWSKFRFTELIELHNFR